MPSDQRLYAAGVYVKVNGALLPDEQMRRVVEVAVDQSLHLPDMCSVRLLDLGDDTNQQRASFFKLLDQDAFAIGREIEIAMGYAQEPKSLFKGEITSIELDVDQNGGPILTVRGYARSHRLHRGRQSRSFLNMSDADIAQKIASEAGLSAKCDSAPTHEYLFQNNQTNWEFLRERAFRLGYELFVEDRTLNFRKPQNGRNAAPEQKYGQNLFSLKVKVSSASQADEVVVKGWDYKAKEAIVGKATSGQLEPKTGLGKNGSQMASTFGKAKVYVVNHPVESQSEADSLAKAIYDELDGSYVEAEGVCLGEPEIRPGTTVKLSQLGDRLSGDYYVSTATHTMSTAEGYRTSFAVSGRRTNTLLESVRTPRDGESRLGIVIGVVTNNSDPDDLGRVKVKFPWLAEDESWWARLASPGAGKKRGIEFVPEIDDEVLVAFEHGDLTRPFVIGGLWNGKDTPSVASSTAVKGGKVVYRTICDDKLAIELHADDGDESLLLVSRDEPKLHIVMKLKDNSIEIMAPGPISVISEGDVSVKADGKTTVKSQGDVSVESQGNVSVKASGGKVTVEASSALEMKGSSVKVEASGNMNLKAGGQMTIKGSMVNIN